MDVRLNRNIDSVIVLGSGESIGNLTDDEIAYINRCKTVIAMNKFMAFYKKSRILPTHVYFHDTHDNSLRFLKHIFDVCRRDGLQGLTFVLSRERQDKYFRTHGEWVKQNIGFYRSWCAVLIKKSIKKLLRMKRTTKTFPQKPIYLMLPEDNSFQFVETTRFMEGGRWAVSLDEPLFHYRGSLSSVLNYVTIERPGCEVYLVGNDFYGSKYFFEDELRELDIDWQDWTTTLVREQGKHFSFQDHKGTKISDRFPEIIERMSESRNRLHCINEDSLLVKECGVNLARLGVEK